jgi:hypothetical protein
MTSPTPTTAPLAPPPVQLTAQQKSNLVKASPQGVREALNRVSSYAKKSRWLGSNNCYQRDTITRLEGDLATAGGLNSRHAADYIAASAPIHCCDGWSLLGRALTSHLHGDPGTAVHLAYYAELRAAMALLATEGIGVFNNKHLVVEQSGRASPIGGRRGTHQAAWLILEDWAKGSSAANTLGSVLLPGNQPIIEWVSSLGTGGSWSPVASDWLLTLGIDLKHFGLDRESRNESSYRPSGIRPVVSLPVADAAIFTEALWSLFEPVGSSAFGMLDKHLLRLSLEAAFEGTTGLRPARVPAKFQVAVASAVVANTSDPAESTSWSDFLLRRTEPLDPSPLVLSRKRSKTTGSTHHLEVISRAALLLRIASGAVRRALFEADVSLETLGFWWPQYGIERGLWSIAPDVADLPDSWADMAYAIDTIEVWLAGNGHASYKALLDECPTVPVNLGRLDVVGIWSLAS